MKFRWMVYDSMKKYVLVWNFSKITYWYVPVYTGMTDITVYGRLSRFMMVWNDWNKYIQVHTSISLYMIVSGLHQTSTYWYILVHPCDMNVHTLINWSLLPVHPAGPPESSGFAASKRHTSSYTHTFIQVWFWLFALPSPLASGGREKVPAVTVGTGQVRCPPCRGTARSSALQASLQCYTDASRSPFCFHLVSRVRTTIVGPARQHAKWEMDFHKNKPPNRRPESRP